jgi:hypothetical protein
MTFGLVKCLTSLLLKERKVCQKHGVSAGFLTLLNKKLLDFAICIEGWALSLSPCGLLPPLRINSISSN